MAAAAAAIPPGMPGRVAMALALEGPVRPFGKKPAAERHAQQALRAMLPSTFLRSPIPVADTPALRRLQDRMDGVPLPPVEVGSPYYHGKHPQQPHPQGRIAMTVAPDMSHRDKFTAISKSDQPPYPDQGFGLNNSIRHGSIVFVTSRLQAMSSKMHSHDRSLVVTASPSGLTLNELRTVTPVGVLSRGQDFNGFEKGATTQNVALSMDVTGLHLFVNRSGVTIPAFCPVAAVLPRRVVKSQEELELYLKGDRRVTPVPASAEGDIDSETRFFSLELVPVPPTMFLRLNMILFARPLARARIGFLPGKTYTKDDYDPVTLFQIMRAHAQGEYDKGRTFALTESPGVDAMIAMRMLSFGAAMVQNTAAAQTWFNAAKQLVYQVANKSISLQAFVHSRKSEGPRNLDGVLELLKELKANFERWVTVRVTDDNVEEYLSFALGTVDAQMAIQNLASHQMNQQERGAIFGVTLRPSIPYGDLEVLRH